MATLYPNNKTTKLNHFHLWFPGGIVIGTLIVYFFDKAAIGWQLQVAMMIIPAIIYGFLFAKQKFPVTERVASGISTGEMYRSLLNPLFFFLIICMFGTAITELFTGQWIQVLLNNVSQNSILILTVTTGVMVVGRGLAGPVVHRLSPAGVLLGSAIFSAMGLYLLGHTTGNMLSENLPKTGAVGINLMGGAGMFAVSLYMMFMGGVYDDKIIKHLPAGANLKMYNAAEATVEMKTALAEANKAAGPEIINTTMIIPLVLIVAFAGLFIYMRKRKGEKNV